VRFSIEVICAAVCLAFVGVKANVLHSHLTLSVGQFVPALVFRPFFRGINIAEV
jgi:hypothetical protein